MEKRDFNIITNSAVNWNMYLNSTVLISGATGRLGRYILETLADIDLQYNLNMRIIGLARSENKARDIFGDLLELPNVSFLYQDIIMPVEYEGEVDFIFHTAGPAAPADFKERSVETLWSHVAGTRALLEFARTHGTKRVLYVSTVEVYGEWLEDRLITENDMGPLHHVMSRASYPEAKRLCETMLASYKDEYGISFCGVRFSHTIGPGVLLDDGRAFAEFIHCALNGENIVLHSDGSAMRTYTYVADGINALFLVMDKGEDAFYNVASNSNLISTKDLAILIARMVPERSCEVQFSEEAANLPYLPFKLAIMDTQKIQQLGWKARVSVEDAFRWTMDSFL